MPAIYGGDEVSAIVLDCGSSSFRVGWAGEDTPRGVFPTSYAYLPDEEEGGNADAGPSSAANGSGNGAAAEGDAMEGVEATDNAAALEGATPTPKAAAYRQKWRGKIHSEKRKRFIGDMGVNMYKPGVEIASPLNDEGVREYYLIPA